MKKQFLVLAGSALLLASCGGEKKEPAGQTQAQIDSAINAKVAEHDAEVAARNDSTLKAVEAEKQQLKPRQMSMLTPVEPRNIQKRQVLQPTPAPPPPPPTVGNGKPSMTNTPATGAKKENSVGNGKPSMK